MMQSAPASVSCTLGRRGHWNTAAVTPTHTYTYTHTYTHIRIYTHIHTHTYTHTYIHMYIYVLYMPICTHVPHSTDAPQPPPPHERDEISAPQNTCRQRSHAITATNLELRKTSIGGRVRSQLNADAPFRVKVPMKKSKIGQRNRQKNE